MSLGGPVPTTVAGAGAGPEPASAVLPLPGRAGLGDAVSTLALQGSRVPWATGALALGPGSAAVGDRLDVSGGLSDLRATGPAAGTQTGLQFGAAWRDVVVLRAAPEAPPGARALLGGAAGFLAARCRCVSAAA